MSTPACTFPETALAAATRLGIRAIDERAARLALQAREIVQREIELLVHTGLENTARDRFGDETVNTWFRDVEGIDPDEARIDFDELARQLEQIGDGIQKLAESIGIPDPGAAKSEDLLGEMWAKVHAHNARLGVHVDEGRALGWSN